MAITREAKEKQLSELTDSLSSSQLSVLCDYRGLSVADIQELRSALKLQGSSFKVIKKTLIKKALGDSKLLKDAEALDMEGQLGLAFGFDDEVSVAQVLAGFAKTHSALEIKAGINQEGLLLSAEEIGHLSTLPSKGELRARLVGTIAAPMSGLVRVLEGNISGLVRIFDQLRQQKAGN